MSEPRPMNCPNCHTQIVSVFAEQIAIAGFEKKATALCCEKCEAVLSVVPLVTEPQPSRKTFRLAKP